MIEDPSFRPSYDNSTRPIPSDRLGRSRTIDLRFDELGDRLRLIARCADFGEDGGGELEGMLRRPREFIENAVMSMCETWDEQVISYYQEQPAGFPFEDRIDVSPIIPVAAQRRMRQRLAWQGHLLFEFLFQDGDAGLREIAKVLRHALRSRQQRIRIRADMLSVPWTMLYTATDPDDEVDGIDSDCDPEGFWGCRHLLEHVTERDSQFSSRLCPAGDLPVVGMNVDPRLDDQYPQTPCVGPMIEFFRSRARQTDVRIDRHSLARAYRDGRLEDEISYFGLHASSNGHGGVAPTRFELGDGEAVREIDILGWLGGQRLGSGPVIFFNACKGGRLGSMYHPSFGRLLLGAGANCLVGPQVDVTPRFAREYAMEFFRLFFERGTRIGDVVHRLARRLLLDHANPLGLAISLYRGLDTHLAPAGILETA
ncbi:hypothetical protein AGRA3207_002151 [Actinomadura graeca]|uniref:CHAT domain-containing protein n=1 Tax=Actinomadura graeca TaxID=2750812 RepID=A0ABX8QV50_9ACTN|nr:hypothetical protein [Actinomadura graeca]QXJ21312.1 hypothetical protein AGRA3207_002151 [Actinomadura graeca]